VLNDLLELAPPSGIARLETQTMLSPNWLRRLVSLCEIPDEKDLCSSSEDIDSEAEYADEHASIAAFDRGLDRSAQRHSLWSDELQRRRDLRDDTLALLCSIACGTGLPVDPSEASAALLKTIMLEVHAASPHTRIPSLMHVILQIVEACPPEGDDQQVVANREALHWHKAHGVLEGEFDDSAGDAVQGLFELIRKKSLLEGTSKKHSLARDRAFYCMRGVLEMGAHNETVRKMLEQSAYREKWEWWPQWVSENMVGNDGDCLDGVVFDVLEAREWLEAYQPFHLAFGTR
jgi:hypothetical protein